MWEALGPRLYKVPASNHVEEDILVLISKELSGSFFDRICTAKFFYALMDQTTDTWYLGLFLGGKDYGYEELSLS